MEEDAHISLDQWADWIHGRIISLLVSESDTTLATGKCSRTVAGITTANRESDKIRCYSTLKNPRFKKLIHWQGFLV